MNNKIISVILDITKARGLDITILLYLKFTFLITVLLLFNY